MMYIALDRGLVPMASSTTQTQASISELIQANLYDAKIVPELESYVLQQVGS